MTFLKIILTCVALAIALGASGGDAGYMSDLEDAAKARDARRKYAAKIDAEREG